MRRILPALLVSPLLGALGWYAVSPYSYLSQPRSAADRDDSEALRDLIDFPSVRESLKEELNAAIMSAMSENDDENPWAAFTLMVVGEMLDRAVDSYVSPAGIAALSRGQPPDNGISHGTERRSKSSVRGPKPFSGYKGLNRFHIAFRDSVSTEDDVVFVLRRSGMGWKLTAI